VMGLSEASVGTKLTRTRAQLAKLMNGARHE
jgi:hypothetical protein